MLVYNGGGKESACCSRPVACSRVSLCLIPIHTRALSRSVPPWPSKTSPDVETTVKIEDASRSVSADLDLEEETHTLLSTWAPSLQFP
jgi:hypothetical protein